MCLDVGDFILTRPCEHKICGEGGGRGVRGEREEREEGGKEWGTQLECV